MRSSRRDLALFLLANATLVALAVLSPLVPPDLATRDPLAAAALLARWLPYSLSLATLLTAALALHAPDARGLYGRHALLWLAYPAASLLVRFGDRIDAVVYGFPYVALVAAIAVHGVVALYESRHVRSDRALGLFLGATVAVAALALLPFERTIELGRSDEPHYLLAMQSLVRDRDLDLTNDYEGPYEDLYRERLPDRHIVQVGSAQPPIHDLGLVGLGAIPFALARRTGVLVLMCLIGGAFAWRGFHLLRDGLAFGRGTALLAAGTVALVHPVFTYTTQVYPDLPAALATLLVAEALSGPPTVRRLGAASALCGALIWLTVRAWFLVGGLGLVLLVVALRTRRPWPMIAVALPFALVAGLYALADQALFGIPLPNAGYLAIRDNQTVVAFTPQVGITGLLLDRTFGLLARAPLYALSFYGAVPLWRRGRALGSAALAALGLATLFEVLYVGNVAYWWSDGSPSSRYLVPTMALLLCAFAAGLDRLRGDAGRMLVAGAAVWTAGVTFLFALIPALRYDIATASVSGAPGALWSQVTLVLRADPALLFPSMVRAAPQDWLLAASWLVLLAAITSAGARRPGSPPVREGQPGRIL